MSYLDYLFDTEYRQRRDINRQHDELGDLHVLAAGVGDDVSRLRATVTQLSATVRVLVRVLADAKLLEPAKLKAMVSDEMRVPKTDSGEPATMSCVKCGTKGAANEMVRMGADHFCRSCARNP
jgi:hypothetical protein